MIVAHIIQDNSPISDNRTYDRDKWKSKEKKLKAKVSSLLSQGKRRYHSCYIVQDCQIMFSSSFYVCIPGISIWLLTYTLPINSDNLETWMTSGVTSCHDKTAIEGLSSCGKHFFQLWPVHEHRESPIPMGLSSLWLMCLW